MVTLNDLVEYNEQPEGGFGGIEDLFKNLDIDNIMKMLE